MSFILVFEKIMGFVFNFSCFWKHSKIFESIGRDVVRRWVQGILEDIFKEMEMFLFGIQSDVGKVIEFW